MKPITYVIGNSADFRRWCVDIGAAQLINVRHITDERTVLGLMRPREAHSVVTLPSADKMAVNRMAERGFGSTR